jgi:antitoxin component YwqK of YwqJK toxin-antitoxin module
MNSYQLTMINRFLLSLLILFPIIVSAQDTIFNTLDKNSLKTGFWKSYYVNGKLRYSGSFANGKPVGRMKKYYMGGLLQADMTFDKTGIISHVKLFNEQGKLVAEGKYIEKLKDSTWNYYSSYDGRLAMRETFKNGKKDGISLKYYVNGKPSELLEWKDDQEHGKWEQYYENGDLRLNCTYKEGKRSGNFRSYNPGGIMSVTGEYKNGIMNGKWTFFNEKGEKDYFVEYLDGKMLPNKEYEKRADEFSKKVEEAAKKAGVAEDKFPNADKMEPF